MENEALELNRNNNVLAGKRELNYYLCSADVVKHFPDLEKSKPFLSGYWHDKEDVYFIIATDDYSKLFDYYEQKKPIGKN